MTDPATPDALRPAALWAHRDGGRLCDPSQSAGSEIDSEPIPIGEATELAPKAAARLWAIAVLERYIVRRTPVAEENSTEAAKAEQINTKPRGDLPRQL